MPFTHDPLDALSLRPPGPVEVRPFDLVIVAFVQFLRPCEIAELQPRTGREPAKAIADRVEELLSDPALLRAVLAPGPNGIRCRRRRYPLTLFEKLTLLCLKHHYQSTPAKEFLHSYRELFHGTHRPDELARLYREIVALSLTQEEAILREFAAWFAAMEARFPVERFLPRDFEEAGLTDEDLEWWRSIRAPAHRTVLELSRPWPDAGPLENLLDWLAPGPGFAPRELGVLWTDDTEFRLVCKMTVIGEGPDVHIPVHALAQFAPSTDGDYRVLLMLKNDLAFYVENVGRAVVAVNGQAVRPGQITFMRHLALLELGDVGFIFGINEKFIANIAKEMKRPRKK